MKGTHDIVDDIIIKEFKYEAEQFSAVGTFAKNNFTVSRNPEHLSARDVGTVQYTVRTLFLGKSVCTDTYTVVKEYPATWWQHFKDTYFPDWLLARYPVKFLSDATKIQFEQKVWFPEADAPHLERGRNFYTVHRTVNKLGKDYD